MNFKKLNNISGWIICIIACAVYILTAEKAGSLWDCGEFVSCANKLQMPHPPGAPLFVLLGRFFIILFGDNPNTAAHAVNIMSAVASGFTILFLYWTITYFGRRIIGIKTYENLTGGQAWAVMGSGVVGALAYTFSDSFWFSAVEGEVYALSSFFTAIVFWAILKWETAMDEQTENSIHPDRWIIFLFFMMGLSIGVHLLNLLCIPAIVMVYYVKKRESFNYKLLRKWFMIVTAVGGFLAMLLMWYVSSNEARYIEKYVQGEDMSDSRLSGLMFLGTLLAIGFLFLVESFGKAKKEYYGGMYIFFLIGCVLTGVVQIAVIQFSIKGAGLFDIAFVNSFHLPFFSGFIFFFVLLGILIWVGIRYAKKRSLEYLRLGLYSAMFILMGYSTYFTTMIRSSADPAIDMYNVDNPQSLVGYLARDQYGDFPIIFGQKFTNRGSVTMETGDRYQKINDKYVATSKDRKQLYLPEDKMFFPRMWDAGNEQGHVDYYLNYSGIGKYRDQKTGRESYEEGRPNFSDNLQFFAGYQFYWMYLRYFLWNFAGKQNDVQGVYTGNVRDGNWKTGIGFLDKMMYGDQSLLPETTQKNKANNNLFALPLILGLLGFIYHLRRKGDDFLVSFLLFFFTGIAINVYLNPAGNQPRERDYAYVGSFYAFAIWIGLGVMAIYDFAMKKDKKLVTGILIGTGSLAVAGIIAGAITGNSKVGLIVIVICLLFAAITLGLLYLFSAIQAATKKSYITAAFATILCTLLVPAIMAQQEWDDHDRSNKTLAGDLARNYLESCPKNAILFAFGDNDTYPLWYAQEVEGVRPDIRVVNSSLLGIDWYINQLRYKVNESDPVDVIWSADQIAGSKRDYITYQANAAYPDGKYYDLYDMMKNYVGKDDKDKVRIVDPETGDFLNTFPAKKVSVPVDRNAILADPSFKTTDSIVPELQFEITKNALGKNDLAVLNVLAANKWKRPICFTSYYGGREGVGFDKYLQKIGLTYRLVPFTNADVSMGGQLMNADWMIEKMMNFKSGNCDKPGVYFDEENRRHLLGMRGSFAELAMYLSMKNRKEDARKVLDKVDKMMSQDNLPYCLMGRNNMHNYYTTRLLDAAIRADHKVMAEKISKAFKTYFAQEQAYYDGLESPQKEFMEQEKQGALQIKNEVDRIEGKTKVEPTPVAPVPVVVDTPKEMVK